MCALIVTKMLSLCIFQFYSGRKHKNVYLARMYDYLSYFLMSHKIVQDSNSAEICYILWLNTSHSLHSYIKANNRGHLPSQVRH